MSTQSVYFRRLFFLFSVNFAEISFVSSCIIQRGEFIMDRLPALPLRMFDIQTADKSDTLYYPGSHTVFPVFQGDSGGPLQVKAHSPMCDFDVVGVISFGLECAKADTPAVYSRVSKYVPWIESVVCSYTDRS